MDRILFCNKRAHLSYTRHANRVLRRWNLTAARMDLFVCHRTAFRLFGIVHQRDLCARLGVSRATITIMLRRMEKCGFIARRRSDPDRRQIVVTITPAGYAAFGKASYLVDKGVYREIVDATLLFQDFQEPVHAKRARFLVYLDNLRTNLGDLTNPAYPLDAPNIHLGAQADAMRSRVDELLARYVHQ